MLLLQVNRKAGGRYYLVLYFLKNHTKEHLIDWEGNSLTQVGNSGIAAVLIFDSDSYFLWLDKILTKFGNRNLNIFANHAAIDT